MDRQLVSPLLISTASEPKRLGSHDAYTALQKFLTTFPPGSSRTQLERLRDSLGVEIGEIKPEDGEAQERKRMEAKAAAKAERRRLRDEAAKEAEKEDLEAQVEGLGGEGVVGEGEGDMEGDMESGAVGMQGEEGMDDRGDVEYGDVEPGDSEDEDEPDNADEGLKMDTDE